MLGRKTGERERERGGGQIEKLIGDQNQGSEAFPRSNRRRQKKDKKDVKRGVTARGAMEKSRYVRVIEGEEVRRDDPIKYFLPTG